VLQVLLLQNARLLPSLSIDFDCKNCPVCNHRAETTPVSFLPHWKTFGGVLRLPSYSVPSPTTSGAYCGLVDGTSPDHAQHRVQSLFSAAIHSFHCFTVTSLWALMPMESEQWAGLTHTCCRTFIKGELNTTSLHTIKKLNRFADYSRTTYRN
jgi:hypothetical protein